ncbi:MAG: PAS domain S-box protein [Deltaproteobacteria bacterium]|nr:PAS domain S-box protein [Deltaproteobacteria bacterium]
MRSSYGPRLPILTSNIILMVFIAVSIVAAELKNKRVLVLHSYHKGLGWTDSIAQGIEETFLSSGRPIETFTEYMDTKRVFDDKYLGDLAALLAHKYRNRRFDAVISSDDHAFQFLLSHHDDITPGIPAVFCGVNYFKDTFIADAPFFTGVVEAFSIKDTIDAALVINPNLKRVYSVVDKTVTGKANMKLLESVIPTYEDRLEFITITDMDMTEVRTEVSRLPPDSIVLLLAFTSDRSGKTFSLEQSADLITAASNRPVFSFWDFHLNHGVVGGMLTTGISQGKTAAELALRIIDGESPADIPVIKTSPNRYIFDDAVLNKFDIDLERLPSGSNVINRPPSFYKQHKRLVWLVSLAFGVLMLLTVLLAVNLLARRSAEARLRKSEDKFRALLETTSDWIWEMDAQGCYTYVSPKVTDHLGYTPGEVLGKTPFDFMPPSEAERVGPIFHKTILSKQRIVQLKNVNRHMDGREVILETTGVPILDADGTLQGYRGVDRDITERHKAEETLRESEERYRVLVENAGEAIFIAQGGILRFANKKTEELTGRTQAELLSLSFDKFIHPDDRAFVLERHVKRQQGIEVPSSYSFRLIDKSGKVKWVELDVVAIEWEERLATLNFLRDITDRKRAEVALRESESNLQSVFEAVPVGICFLKDRVYRRANKNWCDSFGYTEKSLIGKTPAFLYESKEEYERVGKELYGLIPENKIASVHTRLKRSDGELRDVVLMAKPLDSQDTQAGMVTVVLDITDRNRAEKEKRRLEDQLQQSQKMEAIGTLSGGIAHDFNNLLMAIQGRTSIMLKDKDSSHPDFGHLQGIEGYIESAADLTKQLLGFARGGKYEVKPTDLNELIKEEIRMFGRTKKEVIVGEKYEDNLWPVEVDRGQIQQVLLNLYVNAWQAMPSGGELYIRTQNVTLDENYLKPHPFEPGRYVQISVTDTGIGMDKATRERIFDPFFTTKEMGRGTGLGLATAYGILRNHGGFINVYSEKGHGSTFNIYLPASEKEVLEEKKSAGDTLRGTETVLFVDDEAMITETGKDLLELLGYEVLIAGGGKEAIRIYEENKDQIDIVVLDMIMPDMSGGVTYDEMKEINPNVKVLLSSGYSINGQATEILDRGCRGFIQKPFNVRGLSQKLREILDVKGRVRDKNSAFYKEDEK